MSSCSNRCMMMHPRVSQKIRVDAYCVRGDVYLPCVWKIPWLFSSLCRNRSSQPEGNGQKDCGGVGMETPRLQNAAQPPHRSTHPSVPDFKHMSKGEEMLVWIELTSWAKPAAPKKMVWPPESRNKLSNRANTSLLGWWMEAITVRPSLDKFFRVVITKYAEALQPIAIHSFIHS